MLGLKGLATRFVSEDMTAKKMGSGSLEVFATPSLIAFVEETCWKSIDDLVEDGNTTVGTRVDIRHLRASKVGAEVVCKTEVIEVDGKKLVFSVELLEDGQLIGKGSHERFIVNVEKFLARI